MKTKVFDISERIELLSERIFLETHSYRLGCPQGSRKLQIELLEMGNDLMRWYKGINEISAYTESD